MSGSVQKPLTVRDLETLSELEAANRSHATQHYRKGWARPMDCGGSDSSHHGGTLRKLNRRGLADVKSWRGSRQTNWYMINDAGRAALALHRSRA